MKDIMEASGELKQEVELGDITWVRAYDLK